MGLDLAGRGLPRAVGCTVVDGGVKGETARVAYCEKADVKGREETQQLCSASFVFNWEIHECLQYEKKSRRS